MTGSVMAGLTPELGLRALSQSTAHTCKVDPDTCTTTGILSLLFPEPLAAPWGFIVSLD